MKRTTLFIFLLITVALSGYLYAGPMIFGGSGGSTDLTAPGPIGGTTPGSGAFTTGTFSTSVSINSVGTEVSQTATIADTGADSTPATHNLTPTVAYQNIFITMPCNDDDGCTVTVVEGGSETNTAIAHIVNTGSYNAAFSDQAGVLELTSYMSMAPYESLTIQYKTDRWVEIGRASKTIYASAVQGSFNVITSAGVITLTAAQMNSAIIMTAAGDVNIPADQCDTATGKWLTVKSTAAHLNSVTSDDASDLFVLADGTELTATHELDLAGAAGNQVTVLCSAVNKWYIIGEIGTCVTGGVAD